MDKNSSKQKASIVSRHQQLAGLSMRFDQVFSLSSYAFSSLATIFKLLLLSHFLSGSAYIDYSVIFGATVLFSTAFFEWIRATSARLEPVTEQVNKHKLRSQTWSLFAFTAFGVFVALGVVNWFNFLDGKYLILLGCGIVVSASGDLILTVYRANDYNLRFALLQISRALLSSIFAVVTAINLRDPLISFVAYNFGSFLVIGIFCLFDFRSLYVVRSLDFGLFKFSCKYGVPTAISVGLFLLIPNLIRWTVALLPQDSVSIAMIMVVDFLQRPYFIAVGSVQAVMFPSLVRAFEARSEAVFVPHLIRVFRTNLAIIAIITVLGCVVVPFALDYYADKVVGDEIRRQFIYALILFGAQSYIQHSGGVVSSLQRRVWKFTMLAVIEVLLISVALALSYFYFEAEQLIRTVAFSVLTFSILTAVWVRYERAVIAKTVVLRGD